MSAPEVSLRAAVDDAVSAGIAADEIIAVMDGLVTLVGMPRTVEAAPRIAAGLGYAEDLLDGEAG